MTPLPASRSHGRAFPAAVRYPVLALTYVVLKPLMRLVDQSRLLGAGVGDSRAPDAPAPAGRA